MTPMSFRAPAEAHIGHVVIQVADLERSLAYYTDVLGFAVRTRGSAEAQLGAPGDDRVLVEIRERRGVRPVPRRGLLGLYHFAVLVPSREDLGRALAHFNNRAISLGSADHLVSEALYLADPDGLGIEVYADRPHEQWPTRGGEIAMATEPLDLRALVRAAGAEPWSGMPAGTTIGHVHFHVGTIREAEAFYHSALGFDKVVWTYPGALFFSAGGYHHHVGTNTWAAGAPAATGDDARLLEWELRLPQPADIAEVAANAAQAGYDVHDAGADRLITDPWGITVRLTQRSNP